MPEPTPYSARTKARKAALDILFAAEQRDVGFLEMLSQARSMATTPIRELTTTIIHGVDEHLDAIDTRIEESLTAKWTLRRMPAVDRNLARIAVFEIEYTDTPAATAISEAVRLAGDLSTDRSPGFLNGVLRSVADKAASHK